MTAGEKPLIYFADLTHTGQVIASNIYPLGIGLIGGYLLQALPDQVEVELFKYPQDLSAALARRAPRVLGFANYSWNCNLAYAYACRVKRRFPETVIVFGGPNYGFLPGELADFWSRYPLIDFYVIREGERAFVEFVRTLAAFGYDSRAIKAQRITLPNCHYQHEGELITGELLPRIRDLSEIPSPYLMGLMDKFFDNVLVPMIHTTRGCPFTCTFCTEGAQYYNKVAQRVDLTAELRYIAERVGNIQDLFITDANFGMYREDEEKARILAAIREECGWPERIYVSTGKNQQERVIQVASLLKGAMNIGASLQTTDEAILQKIERKNISMDTLTRVARQGNSEETTTYTELILALPGDTVEAHTKSLRDTVTAGMGVIRSYQLILLPQTQLSTPQTRATYGLQSQYRIMQRSLGTYALFGEPFACVEAEEICVATNTLSLEGYRECRELDLTVEIIHNNDMFGELSALCRRYGLSWFDFLLAFHATRRTAHPKVADLYDMFRADVTQGLWRTRQELEEEVTRNIGRYLHDSLGTNEVSKGKAIAVFTLQQELHDILFAELSRLLKAGGQWADGMEQFLQDLKAYSMLRKINLCDPAAQFEAVFQFDVQAFLRDGGAGDPLSYRFSEPRLHRFRHGEEQAEIIRAYVDQYGTSVDGLGKILMRAPLKRLFRTVSAEGALVPA